MLKLINPNNLRAIYVETFEVSFNYFEYFRYINEIFDDEYNLY